MTPFYITIVANRPEQYIWSEIYPTLSDTGKLWLDLARRFHPNTLTARRGKWDTPWPMVPHPNLAMPSYEPGFAKTFSEVSDQRALDIRDMIRQGRRVALYYSGGLDSTVCAVALLKNLNEEELDNVAFCLNVNSASENPVFFDRFLRDKATLLDSSTHRYSDLIGLGYAPITADAGDDIFGTEQATQFYYSYPQLVARLSGPARRKLMLLDDHPRLMEMPYREFADVLIWFLSPDDASIPANYRIGKWFYGKMLENIATSDVPIHSLHDFFWWLIFNLRFTHCSLRGPLFYFQGEEIEAAITTRVVNWFNTPDYQRWSMANNNNGQKITRPTATHYKWAARSYIYEYDRNEWYFNYKIKSVSLNRLLRNASEGTLDLFALDVNYRRYWLNDPFVRALFTQGLHSFNG
jgi:hypothetical protein